MTVQKGLTSHGGSYLQANDGLDLTYGVFSTAVYGTAINAAAITYNDIASKIATGNVAVVNTRPAGALSFLDEREIPNPNNRNLILNSLFRFQDLSLGTGTDYDAKTLYLLYHDSSDANVFTGDQVLAIITEDDATLNLFSKGVGTVITASVPLIYNVNLNPASVSLSILQEVIGASPDATETESGLVRYANDSDIETLTAGDSRVVSVQKSARLLNRTDFKNAVKDVIAEMLTSNTETGIDVVVQSDRTVDFVLSQEWITDLIGAMFMGNTETGGQLIFRDADNTVDYVVKRTEYVDQAAAEAATVDSDVEQWWPET